MMLFPPLPKKKCPFLAKFRSYENSIPCQKYSIAISKPKSVNPRAKLVNTVNNFRVSGWNEFQIFFI
eukprot:UN23910